MTSLIDKFNRKIDYLRLSVTDRCNLRCIYCMPSEGITKLPHPEILSYEEIERFARLSLSLGMSKIRVTGGEPLVRIGLPEFLSKLKPHLKGRALSLTTNGILLEDMAKELKEAGVARINISIDSLNPETYKHITGGGDLTRVIRGLERAMTLGIRPIKINVVSLKGINEDTDDFIHLLHQMPVHVRFIELMPVSVSGCRYTSVTTPETMDNLQQHAELTEVVNVEGDGPSINYHVKGTMGTVGFISPLTNHFCKNCNRLRLTPDGRLLSCLFSEEFTDIKKLLRSKSSEKEIKEAIVRTMLSKPKGKDSEKRDFQMSRIGG